MFGRGIGWQELAIILVIVLILFGPKRLPQLGKMFGKTMRNVKDGMEGKFDDEPDEPVEDVKTGELPKADAQSTESTPAAKSADQEKVG